MQTYAIEIKNADFSYKKSNPPVLNDVTFSINSGEIVGLLGRNGAGKTTLIKLITGLIEPNHGQVKVFTKIPSINARMRSQIGVMHQNPGFDQMLTGWTNLFIAGKFYHLNSKDIKLKIKELEEDFGEFSFLNRPIISYSGGEKRRLQILRALLNNPSLLLLDEPTVGLDVEGRRDFYNTLNNIINSNKITVLWTSHYLEEIERNCQRVIIIDKGRKIADDSIELLKNKPNTQSIVIKFSDNKSKGKINEIIRKFSFTHHPNGEYVFMGNEKTFYSEVLPEIITHGTNPTSVVSKSPSLEDLFFDLISNYDKKTIVKDKGI